MKIFPRILLFVVVVFFLPFSTFAQRQSADLALIKGRIWTGDEKAPWAEAIAIKGNQILCVVLTVFDGKVINRNQPQFAESK